MKGTWNLLIPSAREANGMIWSLACRSIVAPLPIPCSSWGATRAPMRSAGCVVLPVEDSLESIFRALGQAALLHQAGGGTGYSFSHPRPRGDVVASTRGTASGPVSFLPVFNTAAQVLAQGGRRRGASMAVLDVVHPDIAEFLDAKQAGGLEYFNLSVAVTSRFMRAVARGGRHSLVNPRTGRVVARVPAAGLFERICQAAWAGGDPGLLFTDRINRDNPLPSLGGSRPPIRARRCRCCPMSPATSARST